MTDHCPREQEDGVLCGGRLSTPIRGSHTGLWFRTCTTCHTTYSTAITPAEISAGPVAWRGPGQLPFTWQQRLEAREDES